MILKQLILMKIELWSETFSDLILSYVFFFLSLSFVCVSELQSLLYIS